MVLADDTFLFSRVKVTEIAANNLNNGNKEINKFSSGKSASTLTQGSNLKRLFLVERPQRQFILEQFSIIF